MRRIPAGPSEEPPYWYMVDAAAIDTSSGIAPPTSSRSVLRLAPYRREGIPHWIDESRMICVICGRDERELLAQSRSERPECIDPKELRRCEPS